MAAEEAAQAAINTANAAKAALESAKLAETSAARTANAAKVIVQPTRIDMADAENEVAAGEISEAEAHDRYRQATQRESEKPEKRP